MATLRAEPFLDTAKIQTLSGVTLGVDRPTRYVSNPLWPTLPETTQDHNVGYSNALYDGTKTKFWVNGFTQDAATVHLCYAESTDGVTLTRPNQNLVTFAGNTNNNIVSPNAQTRNFYHLYYDAGDAQPYVLVSTFSTSGLPDGIRLFRSADGKNWGSPLKSMSNVTGNSFNEPMSIWKRSDGRWVIYVQTYISARRGVGMLLGPSDGSLTGTWTYVGEILAGTDSRQYYHTSAWTHGEHVYAMIGLFGGYTGAAPTPPYTSLYDRIWTAALYVGRVDDGSVLTLKDEDWLSSVAAASGAWDSSELVAGNQIVEVGNEWRHYYGGDTNPHHTTEAEGDRLLGLATLGRRRVGKVSGTGYVILAASTGQTTNILLNCSAATSGSVEVELIHPTTGAVLTGYSRGECGTVPADTYGHTVTWNGSATTPTDYKAKIYLTNASLSFVEIVSAAPSVPLTVSAGYGWSLSGTTVSVICAAGSRSQVPVTVHSNLGGPISFTGGDAAKFQVSLDGSTWAASTILPAGPSSLYLGVTPVGGDLSLSTTMRVPS